MNRRRAERAANVVVHAGFVLAGIVTTLLGPILPILIARWSLSDEHAGLFFTLQFLGNIAGILSLGALISRRGYGTTLAIGFGLIAAGIAALNSGSELAALAATALFGYGLGLTLSGTNLWVADVAGPKRASALNLANLAWGIGAIVCPGLVLLSYRGGWFSIFLFGVAGFAALIAASLALMDVEPRAQKTSDPAIPQTEIKVPIQIVAVLAALLFLYIGTETSLSGWIAAFAKRMGTSAGSRFELAPMLFWAGILSGRGLAPFILRRMREKSVLLAGLVLAGVCNGALLWVSTFREAAAWVILSGFGLACIYPLLVASLVRHFGEQMKRAASRMFLFAAFGGATMPWAVGAISTHAGNLRVGLVLPLVSCIVMIGLLPRLRE
ncbi:MAG: MFS transporter [Candidatus Acidiferrales bacterium]